MSLQDATSLYQAGQLDDAISSLNDTVKAAPRDLDARGLLAELLCVQGNLERADRLLEALQVQESSLAVGVSLQRQLVRAALARQDLLEAGRVPDVLSDPPEHVRERLRATALYREGSDEEAHAALAKAEEARPRRAGTMNGVAFDELRDLDDLFGGVFEVLTSTGKYYWVPVESVLSAAPRKPERPIDLLWLPTDMSIDGGPEGVVYLPTTYPGPRDQDDALKLGRATDWAGPEGATRGAGLRTFLVGEAACTVMELGALDFEGASA